TTWSTRTPPRSWRRRPSTGPGLEKMEAAYRYGVPHWLTTHGSEAAEQDGAVRSVRHPDPHWGLVRCRMVAESSRMLEGMGLTRVTLILSAPQGVPAGPVRGGAGIENRPQGRLRAVPSLGE
ncbi:hypothetical protein ACWD0G_22215, partial [Streptomyces goshikiensis]